MSNVQRFRTPQMTRILFSFTSIYFKNLSMGRLFHMLNTLYSSLIILTYHAVYNHTKQAYEF